MNRFRKGLALLILAVALVAPTSAFAATDTGDTSESLTVASTVSMTVPATATFTTGGGDLVGDPSIDYSYDGSITIVSSNNPTGLDVTVKVDAWAGPGSITVPTTQRVASFGNDPAGSGALLDASGPHAAGSFASSSTVITVASATGALAGRKANVSYVVDGDQFFVGGLYTSAAHYTVTTRP
jgi:hypothetical protein